MYHYVITTNIRSKDSEVQSSDKGFKKLIITSINNLNDQLDATITAY